MRRSRPRTRASGAVLAALALAGTGLLAAGCADEQERYCDAVREHQKELAEIAGSQDGGALLKALPPYRELAEQAPSDIRAEWTLVVKRLAAVEKALADAEVDPDEFDPKKSEPGVSKAEQEAIAAAATALGDPETVEAMSSIEQHALDVCKASLYG